MRTPLFLPPPPMNFLALFHLISKYIEDHYKDCRHSFFSEVQKGGDTSDNESASDITVMIEEMTETLS